MRKCRVIVGWPWAYNLIIPSPYDAYNWNNIDIMPNEQEYFGFFLLFFFFFICCYW